MSADEPPQEGASPGPDPRPHAAWTRSRLAPPLLFGFVLALAGAGALQVYRGWRDSDLKTVEEATHDHAVSFQALEEGKEVRLLSFPGTERISDIPTFKAKLNRWRVRERDFEALPTPGVHRIVAVGESSTFGTGLAIGERFTELLQADLDRRHPGCCEVLNAGRMGMSTPTALQFVRGEVLAWRPEVLIYDTMANDLRDPDRTQRLDLSPERVGIYEEQLRALAASCAAAGTKIVFWANTIAYEADFDPLAKHRAAMRRVAEETGSAFVDLDALYAADPATPEEIDAFLDRPNWTEWFPTILAPGKRGLPRIALHTDWVHPNRFGSRRLAAGLLAPVEAALGLEAP